MTGDAARGTFACDTLAPQAPQKADASFNMFPQLPQNLAIALLCLLRAARISVCQREYANTAVPQSGRRSFRLRSAGEPGKRRFGWRSFGLLAGVFRMRPRVYPPRPRPDLLWLCPVPGRQVQIRTDWRQRPKPSSIAFNNIRAGTSGPSNAHYMSGEPSYDPP